MAVFEFPAVTPVVDEQSRESDMTMHLYSLSPLTVVRAVFPALVTDEEPLVFLWIILFLLFVRKIALSRQNALVMACNINRQ